MKLRINPLLSLPIRGEKCFFLNWDTGRKGERFWEASFLFVVQSLSHVRLFVTPWTAAHQASLSFTISWSLLKFMSTESMMPSNHLILCHHLSPCPQYFFNGRQYIISFRFVFLHHTEKPVIQAVRSPFLQHWMPYSISDRLYYSIILLVRRLFKTFNGNIYSFKTLYSYKD